MKTVAVALVVTLLTLGCTPKCPKRVDYAVDAALLACTVAVSELPPDKIAGKTPEEWCGIAENFAPYFEKYVKSECPAAVE